MYFYFIKNDAFIYEYTLNFRWLSAAVDGQETNTHPLSSPICGLLLLNYLERSLMIFRGDGVPLGYISRSGRLHPPAGQDNPILPDDIENLHLAKFVSWVCDRAKALTQNDPNNAFKFMDHLMQVIDSGLEKIDSESFKQYDGLSVLISRPLVLVRAFVNLEFQGLPDRQQPCEELHQRLEEAAPNCDGLSDVKLTIRIGEHLQLNDGVVGYFLEENGIYCGEQLFAPKTDNTDNFAQDEHIKIFDGTTEEPHQFKHVINEAPQFMSMLMDPRGVVHCSSSGLPTKSLALPSEQVAGVLKQLKGIFFAEPLLIDPIRIEMPLTRETDFDWSWIQQDEKQWIETSTQTRVERAAFEKEFQTLGIAVWFWLIDNHRLALIPGNPGTAFVLPKPSDWNNVHDDAPAPLVDIERFIDTF
jgi:hypothetical protein